MPTSEELHAQPDCASLVEMPVLGQQTTSERSPTSPGGACSVVYHPSDDSASFEASFEAMRISSENEQDSSIEFILTPPRAPGSPVSSADDNSVFSRPLPYIATQLPHVSSDEARHSPGMPEKSAESTPTLLNPLVPPFCAARTAGVQPGTAASVPASFHAIVTDGKNTIGELRSDAIAALADLGLQPIPSLHGSALLPYARNPS